jgi:hypothetical protein
MFSLSEFEADPSGVKAFVTLDIEASSGSFSGASACVLAEQDLVAFLDSLETLANGHQGDAVLVGGWGVEEDVRVQLFLADRRGHLRVRVMLREVPNLEQSSRLEVFFEMEPAPLLRFTKDLRRVLAERRAASVRMYVLDGPIT